MSNDSKWSLPRLLGIAGAREQPQRQRVITFAAYAVFGAVVVLVYNWLF